MPDEKDRLGDRKRALRATREDQWAHKGDAELLERMRERLNARRCPYCKASLSAQSEAGVAMLKCPDDHGAWLGKKILARLLERRN